METSCHPECATYTEIAWNRVQSCLPVEVIILARVKDIKTCHPEGDGCCQQQNAGVQAASYRDPGSRRGNPQRKPQHHVRPSGHPLRIGVEQQDEKGNWRKHERETIQLARRQYEYSARHHDEGYDEGGGQMTRRKSPRARARIRSINRSIRPAIKCHRGRARLHYGNNDPEQLMERRKTAGGEHRTTKGEWERKNRVLPLDHLQRDAQIS